MCIQQEKNIENVCLKIFAVMTGMHHYDRKEKSLPESDRHVSRGRHCRTQRHRVTQN